MVLTLTDSEYERLLELQDNMSLFLDDEEEEVPMDYEDIKLLYKIIERFLIHGTLTK